jgi:PAS domain S-box-containing protein
MKILFLEEKQSDIKLYESILEDAFVDFEFRVAKTEKDFIKFVNNFHPDIILSGFSLTHFSVNEALTYLHEQEMIIPFVLISGKLSEELARTYIQKGVDDYIPKSNFLHLPVVLQNMIEKKTAVRKKIEADRLRKVSEDRLQTIFNNDPECIFEVGVRGELIEMNPAAFMLTESRASINPKKHKFWEFVDKSDIKKMRSFHQSLFRGNKKDFTFKFISKKGTVHWMETIAIPLRDSERYITSALLIGRNITEKIQALEELKRSEEKFRSLSNNSPVGIFYTDTNGNCLYVNKKLCELSGYNFEEALGDKWTKAFHPDDKIKVEEQWNQLIQHEKKINLEFRFIKPDGKIVWVSGNVVSMRNEKGEITGYIGTVDDITEKKEAELKVKRAENNFYEIFENSPDAIYIEDENGYILNANKEACRFQGIPCEELMGVNIVNLAPPEKKKEILENYKLLFNGEMTRLKSKTWNREGFEIPIEIHCRRIIYKEQPALLLQVRDMSNWMQE